MNLSNIVPTAIKMVKSNAPEILTALGVSGVATTAYLAGKASYEAHALIVRSETTGGTAGDPKERFKERAKLTWKLYIPATVSGAVTVGCIIGASRGNSKRTAAAVTAYSITERAFTEYKEKVVEQIGKGKEEKIRDEIAQDHVNKNPASSQILMMGKGHVLCYEMYTGRYFKSDMESLRKAVNDINAVALREMYVSLEDFYDIIDLPHTSASDKVGWDFERPMELIFSTVLSEDGEPCLAFEYKGMKPLK